MTRGEAAVGWKRELEQWALEYAERLAAGLGRGGVAIGGSIAREQHWEHSDLEIAVLVETHDPAVTHFNVDSGRGVEILQLERGRLESELAQIEAGDPTPVAEWPVQLYRSRITHDPSGLLDRFTTAFDPLLFSPAVLELKLGGHRSAVENALREAGKLLSGGRARAALAWTRMAMNELLLVLHWELGELPRSQNRVDSRLRALAEQHGRTEFYRLFREVFDLDSTDRAVAHDWPVVRDNVLALTELWEGRNSREFFTLAVDSGFDWGEDSGIICAYRLYVPFIGLPDAGILGSLDDPAWVEANRALLGFLGLEDAGGTRVAVLMDRVARSE